MARPVTLFTGQWADLPIAELAAKCGEWGFDGLELASWGDHFDVVRALEDPATAPSGASCSSATGSAAGRSPTTSSARPCAIRSTRATSRSCRPRCGATAIPRACARAPRSA